MTTETRQIDAALTRFVATLTARNDVVVRVDETIDDIAHFDRDAALIRLRMSAILAGRSPAGSLVNDECVRGVLAHEIGHADHTPHRSAPPEIAEWAALLEEPRIERVMAQRRPYLRGPLAVSAAAAVVGHVVREPGEAIGALILIGGRVHAGIFDDATTDLAAARALLDPDDAAAVAQLTEHAVDAADDSPVVMDCAREVARIARKYGSPAPKPGCRARKSDEVARAGERAMAQRPARPSDSHVRDATPAEWAAVRRIETAMATDAAARARRSRHPVATPPGSVRMAELVRVSVQAELGVERTALSWRRRRPESGGAPEVGVIVDRSSSMVDHLDAAASAAWVLQRATEAGDGRVRVWTFADDVAEMGVDDDLRIVVPGAGSATTALAAAVGEYRAWSRGRGSRVLVIVSDGALGGEPALPRLCALAAEGVAVLGLAPDQASRVELSAQLPTAARVEVLGGGFLARLVEVVRG